LDKSNIFADVTEEAAVGAQLLALRDAGGHSRFILIPSHPESDEDGASNMLIDEVDGQAVNERVLAPTANAIELRLVLRELFLLGPFRRATGCDSLTEDERVGTHAQRVAKVCYRKRPCGSQFPQQSSVVVMPPSSFATVLAALDKWNAALPASHSLAPVVAKDSFGPWLISFLSLPPRDSGACVQ